MATRKSAKKKATKKAAKKAVRKKTAKATQTTSKKAAKKAASKKATKKAAKKAAAKPKKTVAPVQKPASFDWLPIVLIVLGLALLVFAVSSLFSDPQAPSDSVVAAEVNGVEITRDQLNTQYAILPEQYKQSYSKDLILQQLIDEQLILERARAEGITVSDEEVNEEIQSILAAGELSINDLQENLDDFNLTIDDFENLIERKIMIEEGMAIILEDLEPISDERVREYYEANKSQFVQDPQVSVRHILIASQRENAAELGIELKEQVENGSDFCALVEEYTDDKGSVNNCGEYTFGRGFMVPEFEQASFSLEPGEVTMVQTAFGYHVIEKLEDIPEQTLPFEEVEEQIRNALNQQRQVEVYQAFLEDAKQDAEIIRYNETLSN